MKRFRITLISLFLFAAIFPAETRAQDYPFGPGERLAYNLSYKLGVISADVAKLDMTLKEETYAGAPCYRLVTKGATSNLVGSLVKINYFYDSRFATSDMTPLKFNREQTEGSYWAKNAYTWENGGRTLKAHVEKSTRPVRDTVFTADKAIYDVITVLYKVRASDLDAVKAGKTLHLVSALDCNVSDVYLSYVQTEDRKMLNQRMVTTDKFVMKIWERKGAEMLDKESAMVISHQGDGLAPVYLWITPDESRTIVEFTTAIPLGNLRGRLADWSGLKRPLTTKAK